MVLENGSDYVSQRHDTYPFVSPLKLDLHGKTVFVTGASKGIGSALAISFAKAGASSIGLAARSSLSDTTEKLIAAAKEAGRKEEPKVFTYTVDVTDVGSVEAASKKFAEEAGGRLDILVNNAGYLSWKTIVDSDPLDWWRNWEINVKGVYLSTKYFLPIMLEDEKSDRTIVNLSSIGALNCASGGSAYQSTKLAVTRFTQFIGVEYGDKGVLAYSVHPGGVPTDMGNTFSKGRGIVMPDTPEICGDTVPFLTSEKREWLQGRYISCTWDMEEFLKKKDDIVKNDLLKMKLSLE